MKHLLLLLIAVCFLCSCEKSRTYNEPINNKISAFIKNNCPPNQSCRIKLTEATDFSWDEFYYFDLAVEDKVIGRMIGKEFSSSSDYYSRKWFFVKDGRVVRSEQQLLYEIDVPIKPQDVVFEMRDSINKFAVFDADTVFEVARDKVVESEYYYLIHVE